jgi:hypothetical protein
MAAPRRYFDEQAFQRDCLDAAAEASTTFYDVLFADAAAPAAAAASSPPPLLLAADSTGIIRAYLSAAVAATWLTDREAEPSSEPVFAWRAHQGAAYHLALVGGALLVSAGDDGFVRGWRLSEVGEAVTESVARRREEEEKEEQEDKGGSSFASKQRRPASGRRRPSALALARQNGGGGRSDNPQLRPAFEVCLPAAVAVHHQHHPRPPAAQALCCVSPSSLYAGASDGGLYCIEGLADGRAAALSSPLGGGASAAGVLALDACPETGAVASGGEDGLVRVWADPRRQGQQEQLRPIAAFAAGADAAAATTTAPLPLFQASPTYVSALAFDRGGTGGWLVAGTGAGDVELYSLPMRALARRAPAAGGGGAGGGGPASGSALASLAGAPSAGGGASSMMVPQALLLRPGEVLAAGTSSAVVAHRFSLEPPSELARCEVATDSAFALASSSGGGAAGTAAGGAIAVAGAGATIELLSAQFTRLGLIQPPPSSNAAVA